MTRTHPHGTTGRIRQGCPCNLCVLVRAMTPEPRAKSASVPAPPITAHLQALYASGWTPTKLADHVGYPKQTLHSIASGRTLWTSRYIAEDILSVPVEERAA